MFAVSSKKNVNMLVLKETDDDRMTLRRVIKK